MSSRLRKSLIVAVLLATAAQGQITRNQVRPDAYGPAWNGDRYRAGSADATFDAINALSALGLDPNIVAIAAENPVAGQMIYWTGAGTVDVLDTSAFMRPILNEPNALHLAQASEQDFEHDIRWFGTLGDGNDTDVLILAAAHVIADGGGGIVFPSGTYRIQWRVDATLPLYRPIWIRGANPQGAIFQAIDANDFAITVRCTANYMPLRIEGIQFSSATARATGGIKVTGNITSGLMVRQCVFAGCDIGYQSIGGLYTNLIENRFSANNYGVWLCNSASNNGACITMRDNVITGSYHASIYADGGGTEMPGNCIVYGGVIEGNPGPIVLLDLPHYRPWIFERVWLENNATAASVDVNGITIDEPNDFYVDDVGHLIVRDMYARSMDVLSDSAIDFERCYHTDGGWDVNSVNDVTIQVCLKEPRLFSSSGLTMNHLCEAIQPIGAVYSNGEVRLNSEIDYTRANLVTVGSMSLPFTPTSAVGNPYSFVDYNAPLYGRCLKMTLAGGQTYSTGIRVTGATIPFTSGKWYYYSLDVRSDSNDGYLSVWFSGSSAGAQMQKMRVTTDRWRRYAGFRLASASYNKSMYFWNPGVTDANFYVADAVLVACSSKQEAEGLMARNAFIPETAIPRPHNDDDPNTVTPVTIVAAADNGKTFSNVGAGEACEWDLPAAVPGLEFGFVREAAFSCTIDPSGTEIFKADGGAGDYLELDTDGDTVRIKCFTAGIWEIVGGYGTYAFEP